ncbi:DUF547 domain-containing protein [Fontimonas sp. SYSU GA230001]|uniref:DUF547 domain-containing protein n=1 Tax=Fontimonas sp. SYSU GA230001 TaxID=3142450 RepID=UPI0032B5874C
MCARGWTRIVRIEWGALFAALLASLGSAAQAAPRADLWPRWTVHDESSVRSVDHVVWDTFLSRYVQSSADGIHRLPYARIDPANRAVLKHYVQRLESVPVSRLARAEQRAYWINLYNALTVDTVLDHYPVDSILRINISPGWFARGPWRRKLLRIEDEDVSLDDIEHRILRPIWQDPRTHYALNCASLGCPNLQDRAYTAANLDALLDAAARAYVNHPRGARVERGKLYVSSIYAWFKADFGGSDAGVIAHLRRYAAPPLAQQLAGISSIAGDAYDWALNDAR